MNGWMDEISICMGETNFDDDDRIFIHPCLVGWLVGSFEATSRRVVVTSSFFLSFGCVKLRLQ